MQRWQPAFGSTVTYRTVGVSIIVLLVAGMSVLSLVPQTTRATADLSLGSLDASGVNQTVDGDVSDVRLNAAIDYQHDIPDATRRIVKLQVGTTKDNLETVSFVQEPDPDGTASGTVDLTTSLFDASALSPEDVDPGMAETKKTDVLVRAVVEVRRAGGEPVTQTVTERVTLKIHDGTELTASVGGGVDFEVVTNA